MVSLFVCVTFTPSVMEIGDVKEKGDRRTKWIFTPPYVNFTALNESVYLQNRVNRANMLFRTTVRI